jgi:hypothetical protein
LLAELSAAWQERVRAPRARAEVAAGMLVSFAALLVARHGTAAWRAGAVGTALVVVAFGVWLRARDRVIWATPARVIQRLAGAVDAERAQRAIRALALIAEPVPEGTSQDLARLHVDRTLAALPRDRILARASTLGLRLSRLTFVLAAGAVALAATRGFNIFEGADVLFATKHEAPLPILWLDGLELGARPPDYLHERERELSPYFPMALPHGTLLTFRGAPLHLGRRLVLTDGASEVPFVDDGTGHAIARWPLGESVSLRVLARFGDVAIAQPNPTAIMSIADEAPTVTLEGAPREIRLAEVGVSTTIPIKYEAVDDHGLREVHLVLRSGSREERRILAKLDGETEISRGGHTLRASDPFIKKSHAPVEVRVEAKDNDPVTGPKWGMSPAIMIVPPEAGEPEASRMDALRKLRDAFVDSLAARMDRTFPVAVAGRAALAEADKQSVQADELRLEATVKATYAGVSVTNRVVAVLKGQMRRVKEALAVEIRTPGSASHARLVGATEKLVLVMDAVVRGQAQRDARTVARALADVADDLALGESQMSRSQDRERGKLRVSESTTILQGGARSLLQLGSLGRDLGEIVGMDLGRVGRASDRSDLVHAEIAAADLAARLKDPDPSFGSQGGSGGHAGSESGGGRGTPGEGDPPDDEEEAFNKAAGELGNLSKDHAEELGKVEQALNEPGDPEEERQSSEEEKSHARAVREATTPLPSVGAGSDSWTNKGAAAREHAEAMARALEEGNASDAVTSGRSALDALDEAKHIAQRERWTGMFSPTDSDADRAGADHRLDAARQKLEPEVKWAEEKLKNLRKRAAQRMSSELAAHGEAEQKLAERTETLREQGEGQQALPGGALEALHQAERAAQEAASSLKRGDVEQGLAQQREAQRRLEAAKEALGESPGEEGGGSNGADDPQSGHADIPNADAHKGPEDFRRRVIQGLGQAASGRQRDAIRRYADGLLR